MREINIEELAKDLRNLGFKDIKSSQVKKGVAKLFKNHNVNKASKDDMEKLNLEIAKIIELESKELPKEKDEIEYPFPKDQIPTFLYRWSSREDTKQSLEHGIKKEGGIHDGIPTLAIDISQKTLNPVVE